MLPVGFEPTVSKGERLQAYALDRGHWDRLTLLVLSLKHKHHALHASSIHLFSAVICIHEYHNLPGYPFHYSALKVRHGISTEPGG